MMKKIKIAHVVLGLDVGGLETLVVDMLRHMDRDRFDGLVVCIRKKGKLAEQIEGLGFKVYCLEGKNRLEWSAFFKLAQILRKEGVGAVHAHNNAAYMYAGVAAILAGFKRTIYTEHGRVFPDTARHMMAERILSCFTYRIVAVSEDMKRCLIRYEKINPKKIQVIHNGVDTEKFHKINDPVWRAEKRKVLGIGKHDIVIGNVARFDPVKDHPLLLKAFKKLLEVSQVTSHKLHENLIAGRRMVLLIVGDGPERANIDRMIRELGLRSKVLCLGTRSDIPELMNIMDVFVLSSKNEGISLTLLEAMACGVPVVATRVGGNPEVVKDGESGLLADPGDPQDLAEKIFTILNLPVACHSLRTTLKSMLTQYEDFYAGK